MIQPEASEDAGFIVFYCWVQWKHYMEHVCS